MSAARRKRFTRTTAGAAILACVALAGPAQAKPTPGDGEGNPLPRVNMERLLIAAQLDAFRPAGETTKGATRSVKRVQRALRKNGFKIAVDGRYGGETLTAYINWEKHLGLSGIYANGLPGPLSLAKLGEGRFTVTRPVSVGGRVTPKNGKWTLNTRTNRMRLAAGRLIHCKIHLTQGSYNTSVEQSAGTHAGGGAMDVRVDKGCGVKYHRTVRALRRVGFAAWYRPKSPDWDAHIHAIAISDPDMSTPPTVPGQLTALPQVVSYARKGDGFNTPAVGLPMTKPLHTWEQFRRSQKR